METRTIPITGSSQRHLLGYTFLPGRVLLILEINTELLVNGHGKGVANCHNSYNKGYENCANAVPVVLKKGDKVNIRTTYANSLIRDWSSFKGWKV